MPKVTIDGIEYAPVKYGSFNRIALNTINITRLQVARDILEPFWGEIKDDKDVESLINNPNIKVLVNFSGEGRPILDVINKIVKQ